jgi:hypothetical protein
MTTEDYSIFTHVAEPAEPQMEPKSFSVLLGDLFKLYFAKILQLILPMVIMVGVLIGVSYLLKGTVIHRTFSGYMTLLGLEVLFITIYSLFYSVVIRIAAQYIVPGKAVSSFKLASGEVKLFKAVGAIILMVLFTLVLSFISSLFLIMSWVGLILVIVVMLPVSVYFSVKWGFILHAVVIEGYGPVGAFGRSSGLVEDNWWGNFGKLLVIGLIGAAVYLALHYSLHTHWSYIDTVAMLVIIPFGGAGTTLIYYDLRTKSETTTLAKVMSELGKTGEEVQ